LPTSNKLTERTVADTCSRSTTNQKGERKTILDLSADADLFYSTDPNLIDLDASINEKKVVGAMETKLLREKRQKRIEILQ